MSHWPQYAVIVMCASGFGVHCARNTEPMGGKYNPVIFLIRIGIWSTMLYYGGFFAPMGWAP